MFSRRMPVLRVRSLFGSVLATLLLTLSVASPAIAADPASGVPPDGPAGPTISVGDVAHHRVALGSMATITGNVIAVSRPNAGSPTTAAEVTLQGSDGSTIRAHLGIVYQATYNVKKQNWIPLNGWTITAQGRVESYGGVWFLNAKRWAETPHLGPTVHSYDITAGKFAEGAYVWLAPVKLSEPGFWDDGDRTFWARDAANGMGAVYLELPPVFQVGGGLRVPNVGEIVQPYGMVHQDPDHGWWEIHPVRCWSPNECAGAAATWVQNGVVTQPPPPPPPPGNGTNFTATFGPKGNEWWVETSVVSSGHAIASVGASLNGASPVDLPKDSWGTWAKSIHAPSGAVIRFTATDTGGAKAQSSCYGWPAVTATPCSSGRASNATPITTTPFTATWTLSPNINNWWVEVSVSSPAPVASVDAAVEGGAWIPLTHQSWGSWAKSFHVASGARVQFRGNGEEAGQTTLSQTYTWP